VAALPCYYFLIRGILDPKEKTEQSMATWVLWGILDALTLWSVREQEGNWPILALYVLGNISVSIALLYTRQFSWTSFENFIVFLVLGCLVFRHFGGPIWLTGAGTTAVALATLPQIRDSWIKPNPETVSIWWGFTIANVLSFLGGKDWSIEERLYPGVCVVLCLTLVIANKRHKKNPGI